MPHIVKYEEEEWDRVMGESAAAVRLAGPDAGRRATAAAGGKTDLLEYPIQRVPGVTDEGLLPVKVEAGLKPFSIRSKMQSFAPQPDDALKAEQPDSAPTAGGQQQAGPLVSAPSPAVQEADPTHRLHDVEAHYSYSGFCGMLEAISDRGRPGDRLKIMANFWDMVTRDLERNLAASDEKQVLRRPGGEVAPLVNRVNFFAFLRLVLPHLDSKRATYGLKESKIAQYYTNILRIPVDSPDAQRLMKWKDPTKTHSGSTSFSDVLYTVMVKRGFREAARERDVMISIKEVNETLDSLAQAESPEKKRRVFMQIIRRFNALEQKWLVRIIVKDMKLHISHASVLGRFHPLAMPLLNNTTDLEHVCRTCVFLQAPDQGQAAGAAGGDAGGGGGAGGGAPAVGVRLFGPFKPMLASLVTHEKLMSCISSASMWVEPKYDGERIVIHFSIDRTASPPQPRVKFLTRNSIDYTELYGPKFVQPVLAALQGSVTESCILDGELLVHDAATGTFKRFGTNKTFALDFSHKRGDGNNPRKNPARPANANAGGNENERFCYMAFDMVHLNGQSLLHYPLEKRRAAMKRLVKESRNEFEVVPLLVPQVRSLKDVLQALDDAVCTMETEGIILKNSASLYVPGERKLNWLKLKRDHIHGLADTLDLAVLGAYHGTKFGRKGLSHFLLGVHREGEGGSPGHWETFTKVGTGYNRQELDYINQRLGGKWLPYSPAQQQAQQGQAQCAPFADFSSPAEVLGLREQLFRGWKPAADDVPDVFIHPACIADTLVLEVIGYAFTETLKFQVGRTFRFPRVMGIRVDKTPADATNYKQLLDIMEASASGKKLAVDLADNFALNREARRGAGGADIIVAGEAGDTGHPGPARRKAGGRRGRGAADLLSESTAVNYVQRQQMLLMGNCLAGNTACTPSPPQGQDAGDGAAAPTHTEADPLGEAGASQRGGSAFVVSGAALSFCVLQCEVTERLSKEALEVLIRSNGGRVVANPCPDSLLIASSAAAARVRHWRAAVEREDPAMQKYHNKSILHHSWVLGSIAAQRPLPCAPRYVVYASPELNGIFSKTIDRLGDTFFTDITPEALRGIVSAEKLSGRSVGAADTPAAAAADAAGRQQQQQRKRKRGGGASADADAASLRLLESAARRGATLAALRREVGWRGGVGGGGRRPAALSGTRLLFLPGQLAGGGSAAGGGGGGALTGGAAYRLAMACAVHHGALLLTPAVCTPVVRPTHVVVKPPAAPPASPAGVPASRAQQSRGGADAAAPCDGVPTVSCLWVLDSAAAGVLLPHEPYAAVAPPAAGAGAGEGEGEGAVKGAAVVLPAPKRARCAGVAPLQAVPLLPNSNSTADTAREAMEGTVEFLVEVGQQQQQAPAGGALPAEGCHGESVFPDDSLDFASSED